MYHPLELPLHSLRGNRRTYSSPRDTMSYTRTFTQWLSEQQNTQTTTHIDTQTHRRKEAQLCYSFRHAGERALAATCGPPGAYPGLHTLTWGLSATAESASYSHMACGHSQTHNTHTTQNTKKTTQGYRVTPREPSCTAPQSHPVSIVVAG